LYCDVSSVQLDDTSANLLKPYLKFNTPFLGGLYGSCLVIVLFGVICGKFGYNS